MKKIDKTFLLLSILMTFLIWTNSVLPSTLSSEQSGFFVSIGSNILSFFKLHVELDILSLFIRKLAHFVQFFILGCLWFFTMFKTSMLKKNLLIIILCIGLLTAIIDESIQIFIPGRAFAILDILIDFLGFISALGLMTLIKLKKGNKYDHV